MNAHFVSVDPFAAQEVSVHARFIEAVRPPESEARVAPAGACLALSGNANPAGSRAPVAGAPLPCEAKGM